MNAYMSDNSTRNGSMLGMKHWQIVAVFLAIFLFSMTPILSTPILPMIDFYNHLARYFVLSNISDSSFLKQYYAENWSLLPNIGMDIIGTLMMKFFPPLISSKIICLSIFVLIYTGVILLSRVMNGKFSILSSLLVVPLLYSYVFTWGFVNFLFALGLVLWAAAWWLFARRRLALAIPIASALAIFIFLAHGLAFALYGILVGALELGLLLKRREFNPRQLLRSGLALGVQAVIPVIMFLNTTTAESDQGITNADESIRRLAESGDLGERFLNLVLYRAETIFRVAEGPNLWFDLFTLVATLCILGFMVFRRRLAINPVAWPAIAIGILLVIITPPALFGVGYVADRMPLFLALLGVASLNDRMVRDRSDRLAVGLIALLVATRLVYIGVDWQQYRDGFSEFRSIAKLIEPGSLITDINVALDTRTSSAPRCEMYGPLLVALYGQASPLFANSTQQPLKLVGDLQVAFDEAPKPTGLKDRDAPAFYDRFIRQVNAGGRFRYILICQAQRLRAPLPADSVVLAKTPQFTLVQLHAR